MRLVNTETLRLEFFEANIPVYATLSHTWGDEEILYEDLHGASSLPITKKGWGKFAGSCARAKQDGYEYIWIDTCCINKSSSAELSESINAMFQLYQNSHICYAYLFDCRRPGWNNPTSAILGSRWFSRGWTLQELIAPEDVLLVDEQWNNIGRKSERPWCKLLSKKTSVPESILQWKKEPSCYRCIKNESLWRSGALRHQCNICNTHNAERLSKYLKKFSVYERMTWACSRMTTRPEDEAYCLLGIFDVNMPLLYGEGHKAFDRLQKEIMLRSNDQSILVREPSARVLATGPKDFIGRETIFPPQQSFSSIQEKSHMRPTSDSQPHWD